MSAQRDDWEIPAVIGGRLRELGRSQAWLGEAVAEELGAKAFSQSAVSSWITGVFTPSPQQVFAMERVLGFRPGVLSQHWGYLPLTARSLGGGYGRVGGRHGAGADLVGEGPLPGGDRGVRRGPARRRPACP